MGEILGRLVLPLLLLSAALQNWSLISLVYLSTFLVLQFDAQRTVSSRHYLVSLLVCIFSFLALLSFSAFYITWKAEGEEWFVKNAQWANLVGFLRSQSPTGTSIMYYLATQVAIFFVALAKISRIPFARDASKVSISGIFHASLDQLGSLLGLLCWLLLPCVQLVVGISHPSWASFPFFLCSCAGLVDWSLTSSFLGLFRWWRFLFRYAGFNIFLLYIYQLPIEWPESLVSIIQFVGLFKASSKSVWSEFCSGISLLLFYVLLSWIRCDLQEMDIIMSTSESSLTERLLPPKHHYLNCESRSESSQMDILSWRAIFQSFSINFFTYGFPVMLLALSIWSFIFASLCSFALLAYVGYILYAFPSMFRLHRLNGLLLVFILSWTAGTYIFNVAFSVLNTKWNQDMGIWETIGLWHYHIPGLYLLAQFGIGVFVAVGNLVNSFVFMSLSERDHADENEDLEDKEDIKVLVVATIMWVLRKTSRAITLTLIFFIAMRPGFINAVYMIYFLVYLLSYNISKKIGKTLILLCEVHFMLLYILQLDMISHFLNQEDSLSGEILRQLGLNIYDNWDFLRISMLGCFCAINHHGTEMLLCFSAVIQQTPFPPIGFDVLKAGLIKSVIFLVCTSRSSQWNQGCSHEQWVTTYLRAIGQKFLSIYHSFGTFVAFFTILVAIYLVTPNYISFGYLFFLLLWIAGRQLSESNMRVLWFPLKLYSIAVFIFIYSLSLFSEFQVYLSGYFNLRTVFGYDPEYSAVGNARQPLAVLIVIQLFSYERRKSKKIACANYSEAGSEIVSFWKRLLIWHGEKILYSAVLYASLYPISAFGSLYLLLLVICSTLPKSSQIPSKLFLVYSGCLAMIEYLYQMWGDRAQMFPGQKNSYWSLFLGLQLYSSGFWGIESGFRGKVLVIVACTLEYNIFRWSEKLQHEKDGVGICEEVCTLFGSAEDIINEFPEIIEDIYPPSGTIPLLSKGRKATSDSVPPLGSGSSKLHPSPLPSEVRVTHGQARKTGEYLYTYFWESSKGSNKWNRRRILYFRRERLQKQKMMLKLYLKLWIENMFSLFGLEINMVALLLASFALLNSVSLLYVTLLAACVLLDRRIIQKMWPAFVFLFASIVGLEYFALWSNMISEKQRAVGKAKMPCHDCWRASGKYFEFCTKCWLGIIVDDSRMLISYYVVFMFSCFKLRADRLSGLSGMQMYHTVISRCKKAFLLSDLSFETKELWTLFDYLRHYSYCHLLDLVLGLILITGTLEYDVLHLGYLGFALIFFRKRLEILKKKNRIFKHLRIYNFCIIVISLAYQSPLVGDFIERKWVAVDYISEVVGLYKYDYGFRITSRSALVEIVIFMVVSLQSCIFSSQEFEYVSKYLEAEQIRGIVRQQEKRAAWKTAQLQHIRRSGELKRQRNSQVEKMKSEMLNLQTQLHGSTPEKFTGNSSQSQTPGFSAQVDGFNRVHAPVANGDMQEDPGKLKSNVQFPLETVESTSGRGGVDSLIVDYPLENLEGLHKDATISNTSLESGNNVKVQTKENPLISAVHLIGDGVSQVQSLGNLAVTNLVTFLNIEHEGSDITDCTSEDEVYYEIESHSQSTEQMDRAAFNRSGEVTASEPLYSQIMIIMQYTWSQMTSNNDYVCYCCFLLMFLWNFSLLSMVYLAALFLYALCINTGPGRMFWVIVLIYSEMCILLQYLYQIIIRHSLLSIPGGFLEKLGFPSHKIVSFFVVGNLPLFMVYIFTLLQTSIVARNGDWRSVTRLSVHRRVNSSQKESPSSFSCTDQIERLLSPVVNAVKQCIKGIHRYWTSLTEGAETPPFFVQVSLEVNHWPEDGIQPDRIESRMNRLLRVLHVRRCKSKDEFHMASRVRIQSIERSIEDPNIAIAVFEVLYASSPTESSAASWYASLTPAADVSQEILKAKTANILNEVGFPYPIISVIGGGKREIDLYAYVFGADLVVFFLVAIFYQSVIKNKSEILEVYQLEDQFPKEFVFILMVIFFLIVLDRVIYLCAFTITKVIFYLFSLSLFTYMVTKYAWYTAPPSKHAGRFALRAIYLTKSTSLALQAVQIRYGIPSESTLYRQFLKKGVTNLNFWGFRLYRSLPFLHELRCVLDWSCTATSLTMYDWLKLEDIHASLFLVKCDAELNRANHVHGKKQSKVTKFCSGICLFLVLVCVIWAPMLMYSSGNPTNIANPIKDASVWVNIETESGKLTLFETTLCEKIPWEDIDPFYDLDPFDFLSAYNVQDIQLICCQADASRLWLVPPVVQARFTESLHLSMKITFTWQLTRARPKGKEVVKYELDVESYNLPNSAAVMKVLTGRANNFTIYDVYPRFFRVTGSGDVRPVEQAVDSVSGDLVLNRGNPEWWSFHDIDIPNVKGCRSLSGPTAVVVSEETPQGILGETLSKFSIWGLYLTFVLAVGRFIRLQCADLRMRIPYENLPSCDRLLAICENIYTARAEGVLEVEEVLYWTLVKIYRTSHMLLEYTKKE
ncbi:hypothetical protein MLD38_017853 [Melastoma candidum]|uniref:Uncharacterized protein n=1 Tax=Melastoma candidum TaxID=119954 RepID=A0ACB9QT45_9MYRT|nr:hypothetical protein MLD38_017853 [Melastoma candidum]